MAGLVTEAYKADFVGAHPWRIPIFLFREHDDVDKYLWALRFDPGRVREIYGRHGTDFVGITLDHAGEVVRVIAGEAKWRKSLTAAVVADLLHGQKERNEAGELEHNGKGIWFELNRDTVIPHGLRQLQFLLQQRDPEGHEAAIISIDRAVLGQGPPPARTDLVVIAGNGAKRRNKGDVLIGWEEMPAAYQAGRDLQVVELILDGGDDLIDPLYTSLWSD